MKSLRFHPSFKYHPICELLDLTHLTFGDDLLFFSKGKVEAITALMEKFEDFSNTSGLTANKRKSEIYFSGVSERMKETISTAVQL